MTSKSIKTQNADCKEEKPTRVRCWELDFLRGFAIIMVLLDHTMYDIANIFGSAWRICDSTILQQLYNLADWYVNSQIRAVGWIFFVFIFFFVSGICTSLSRSNIKRGLKLVFVAGLISGVTYFIQEVFNYSDMFIWIGVIHCLSFVVMFYAVVQVIVALICKQNNRYRLVMLVTTSVILIVGLVLNGIYNVSLYSMAYYNYAGSYQSFIAGVFVYTRTVWEMANLDYFPVLVYLCMFLAGAIVGQLAYRKRTSLVPKLECKLTKPVSFCGRHSLLIYLGIQVLMLPILYVITVSVTGSTGMF